MTFPEGLKSFLTEDVWSTVLLLAILLFSRALVVRLLQRDAETLSENRRRWISVVQNTTFALIALGVVFIWLPELSTFALSLTAFAVALVFATKEFLMCLVGTIYRASARPFGVGDWIEVGTFRGEVVSEGILTTRLQELDCGARCYQYSGRLVSLPNSALLSNAVVNESYRKRFVHHSFSITLEPVHDIRRIKKVILDIADRQSRAFDDLAERYWRMVRQKLQTELPGREPKVSIETTPLAKVVLKVTVFCPTELASALEDTITESVLAMVYDSGADTEGYEDHEAIPFSASA